MKKLLHLLLTLSLIVGLFLPFATASEGHFTDVSTAAWYYEGVSYVKEEGIMYGLSPDIFSPETAVSRAMMVTVLWRLAGKPDLPEELGYWLYHDIPSEAYYEFPAHWAKAQELMVGYPISYTPEDPPTGYSSYLFRPNDILTREQLATVLYRYAKWVGMDVTAGAISDSFPDETTVSPWAAEAMQWCIARGLIQGTTQNGIPILDPKGSTTRGQLATILMRFAAMSNIA